MASKRELFHAALFWPILVCGTGGFVTQGFSSSDVGQWQLKPGLWDLGVRGCQTIPRKIWADWWGTWDWWLFTPRIQ